MLRQIGGLQQATADLRKLDGFVRSTKPPPAEVTVLQVHPLAAAPVMLAIVA